MERKKAQNGPYDIRSRVFFMGVLDRPKMDTRNMRISRMRVDKERDGQYHVRSRFFHEDFRSAQDEQGPEHENFWDAS